MPLTSMLVSYTVPPPRFSWVEVAGGVTEMAPFTGYRAKGILKSVLVLPELSSSDGCRISVDGYSGGWEIRCESGQKIVFGSKESSTSGSGGMRSTHPTNFADLVHTGQGVWKVFGVVGVLELF